MADPDGSFSVVNNTNPCLKRRGIFYTFEHMVILYPTETIYGLGVNPLDKAALMALYELKGRDAEKSVSWLVRDISDIERYAVVSDTARKIAERFLPGPLTLVLPAKKESLPTHLQYMDTIGFRVSPDPIAQKVIAEFMGKYDAPLTCTSANVSGMATQPTVEEILRQFGEKKHMITEIYDDGKRSGLPSTIVSIRDHEVVCLREGAIPYADIQRA